MEDVISITNAQVNLKTDLAYQGVRPKISVKTKKPKPILITKRYWTSMIALRDHEQQNNWLPLYRTKKECAHYYGKDVVRVELLRPIKPLNSKPKPNENNRPNPG
jgi:hypothetical protein